MHNFCAVDTAYGEMCNPEKLIIMKKTGAAKKKKKGTFAMNIIHVTVTQKHEQVMSIITGIKSSDISLHPCYSGS